MSAKDWKKAYREAKKEAEVARKKGHPDWFFPLVFVAVSFQYDRTAERVSGKEGK